MKSIAGSDVPPVSEDKTYVVKHGFFCAYVCIFLFFVPFAVGVPLTIALNDEDDRNWWWIGVIAGSLSQLLQTAFRTSCKIVLHSDQTVSHLNLIGMSVCGQDHLPLSKYATIQVNGQGKVSYVKTDEYVAEIQARLCSCFRS